MEFTQGKMEDILFHEKDGEELFIKGIGFHNFNYIRPIYTFRVQSFHTLHIVLEGSGTLKVEDKVYSVKKGDMFYIPPDTNLCYYPDDEFLWQYIWIKFEGKMAHSYGEKFGFKNTNLKPCKDFINVYHMFKRIFDAKDNNIPIGYYDVVSLFYKLLDINTTYNKTTSPTLCESVMTYIDCHLTDSYLSLEKICEYFNISHSYLCKIFKNEKNITAKNYIVTSRINLATKLLTSSDLRINEIAYSVGFSDEIHFMKTFKKIMGVTPSEYKKGNIG